MKPNIIFICTDQQRSDSLACTGNPVSRTPNIDSIAEHGLRFSRHNTPMQICSPSRATMMTGLYPRNHQLIMNGMALNPQLPNLPSLLAQSGYQTHGVGKQHLQPILAPEHRRMPDSRAFWRTEASKTWNGPFYGYQSVDLLIGESDTAAIAGHYAQWLQKQDPSAKELLKSSNSEMTPPADLDEIWRSSMPVDLYYNTWISDRAIEFIENQKQSKDKPFYLFVSYPDPHHPFAPPGKYADRFKPEDMPLPRNDPGELDRMPDYYRTLWPKGQGFRKLYWAAHQDMEAGSMMTTEEVSDQSMQMALAHTYGMIEMLDDGVGRILDTLNKHQITDNTIIIFTSDHGELLGTHGLLHKGPPPYKQLTEIALLMQGPGIPQNTVTDQLTNHIDLMPTLLDLTGIKTQYQDLQIDGKSMQAIFDGSCDVHREYDFGEFHPSANPLLYNQTIRTRQWRLTIYPKNAQWGELFYLIDDPEEHLNLYFEPEFEKIKNTLAAVLAKEFPPQDEVSNELICKW